MINKKIEVIQEEISDCGVCCLESIIKYYGGYVPLEKLRLDTFTDSNGTNAYELIKTIEKYGFISYAEKCDDITNIKTPVIAHMKLENGYYHFIVVYKIIKNKVLVMDPSYGLKKIDLSYFNNIFNKVIIHIIPTGNIELYKNSHFIENFIYKYVRDNKLSFIFITIISFFILLLSLLENIEVSLINKQSKYILLFVIVICINNILIYIKNKLILNKSISFNNKLTNRFVFHLFKLPLNYLKLKEKGEMSLRFSELNEISGILVHYLIELVFNILQLIITNIIVIKYVSFLIIPFILFSITYFLINHYLYKKYINDLRLFINLEENYNNKVLDYISKILTIKHLNVYDFFINNININIDNKNKLLKKINNKKNIITCINNIVINIFLLFTLYKLLNNIFVVDTSLIIFIFVNYYINLLKEQIELYPSFLLIKNIIRKNNDFLSVDFDTKNTLSLNNVNIDIKNLSYSINGNNIINNISYIINSRDKIFIKGPSGSGKSTFLNIINGTITNYTGRVLFNNYDLKNYDFSKYISYIGQEDKLFDDTLINNITLNEKIDVSLLNDIIKICRIDTIDIVRKYGYNLNIINDNIFSGGEKNRIILARILVRAKSIIILDEVLKEVDYDLEKSIIEDVINYFKNNIIIYVSHKDVSSSFSKVLTFRKD